MSTDPVTFLETTFPAIFDKAIAQLREKSAAGDEKAKKLLEDSTTVVGAAVIALDGAGTVYLTARDGKITPSREKPADVPMRIAVGCEADALEVALGEAINEGALDDPRVLEHTPHLASKRLEQLLNNRKLTCHVFVKDHPDLGDVTIRLGFNVDEPPEKPGFTAEMKFSDLESMRSGDVDLQKMMMGGKLRLKGDYSVALQIGMQLAQEAQMAARAAAAKKA